jgi:flagellar protein FlbD
VILVTRLDGSKYYINPEMILTIECTPDSVITLKNNVKFVVRDNAEEIVKRFIEYQQISHYSLK